MCNLTGNCLFIKPSYSTLDLVQDYLPVRCHYGTRITSGHHFDACRSPVHCPQPNDQRDFRVSPSTRLPDTRTLLPTQTRPWGRPFGCVPTLSTVLPPCDSCEAECRVLWPGQTGCFKETLSGVFWGVLAHRVGGTGAHAEYNSRGYSNLSQI